MSNFRERVEARRGAGNSASGDSAALSSSGSGLRERVESRRRKREERQIAAYEAAVQAVNDQRQNYARASSAAERIGRERASAMYEGATGHVKPTAEDLKAIELYNKYAGEYGSFTPEQQAAEAKRLYKGFKDKAWTDFNVEQTMKQMVGRGTAGSDANGDNKINARDLVAVAGTVSGDYEDRYKWLLGYGDKDALKDERERYAMDLYMDEQKAQYEADKARIAELEASGALKAEMDATNRTVAANAAGGRPSPVKARNPKGISHPLTDEYEELKARVASYERLSAPDVTTKEYVRRADFDKYAKQGTPGTADFIKNPKDAYNDFIKSRSASQSFNTNAEGAIANAVQGFGYYDYNKADVWGLLTDDEKKVWYYKYRVEGEESADKYLDDMTDLAYFRARQELQSNISNAGFGVQYLATLASIPENILRAPVGFAADVVGGLTGEYHPYDEWHPFAQDIRSGVSSGMTGFENFLYGGATSAAESAIGAGTMGAGYAYLMGASAASQRARELWEEGASGGQIAVLSGLDGVAEALFEHISLEKLLSPKAFGGKNAMQKILGFTKEVAKQGFVEGSEEVATGLANVANDIAVRGTQSDTFKRYQMYLAKDDVDEEQALELTLLDTLKDLGVQGLEGAFSGVLMGTGFTAAQYSGLMSKADSGASKVNNKADAKAYISEMEQERAEALMDGKLTAEEDAHVAEAEARVKEQFGLKDATVTEAGKIIESDAFGEAAKNRVVRKAKEAAESEASKDYLTTDSGVTEYAHNGKVDEGVVVTRIIDWDGERMYELGSGDVVSADSVMFGTKAEATVYGMLNDYKVDGESATQIAKDVLAEVGDNAETVKTAEAAMNAINAYNYGELGLDYASAVKTSKENALSSSVMNAAYDLGRAQYEARAAERQAAVDRGELTYRRKGEGTVVYEDNVTDEVLADMAEKKIDKTDISALDRLASALGINIHLYATKVGEDGKRSATVNGKTYTSNGFYDHATGDIYIDVYSGRKGNSLMMFTLAHELTHFIAQNSPAQYKAMADFLVKTYGEKGGEDIDYQIQRQIEKAKKDGREIDREEALEEVVADSMEAMFADGEVIKKLASENPSLAKRILAKIKEWLDALVGKYKTLDPDSEEGQKLKGWVDEFRQMQDMFVEALKSAKQGYAKAGVGEATSEEVKVSEQSREQKSVDELREEARIASDEWVALREQKNEIEFSDEYKEWVDRIVADPSEENLAAYKKWEDSKGISELWARENEARVRYMKAQKAYSEAIERAEEEAEKKAQEASGLSEADYYRKKAVAEFGYTPYFYDAGYITPNGRMLNFSGEKGKHYGVRGEDHRGIGVVYPTTTGSEAMLKFMGEGNIRIMDEMPGIDISSTVAPTKEQYATIERFVNSAKNRGYFSVDFTDANGNVVGNLEYEDNFGAVRVVNDIRHFYATGEVREQSDVARFHYSSRETEDTSNRAILSNALESAAQTPEEKTNLARYRETIGEINAAEARVKEINAEIKELSFAKGERDTARIAELQKEKAALEKKITAADSRLLKLEASTPLKDLVRRTKENTRKAVTAEYVAREAALRKERDAEVERVRLEERWKGAEKSAELRRQRDETIEAVREKYRQRIADMRSSRSKAETRRKLERLKSRLRQMLLRPSENKYVTEDFLKPVAEMLDMLSTYNGKSKRLLEQAKLLKEAYAKAENRAALDAEDLVARGVDENGDPVDVDPVQEAIDNLWEVFDYGDKSVRDLTPAELDAVYQTAKMIEHLVTTATKTISTAKARRFSELKEKAIEELNKGRGVFSYNLKTLRPKTVFEIFGNFTKDGTWSQIYDMLNDAALASGDITMDLNEVFAPLMPGDGGGTKVSQKTFDDFINPDEAVDIGLKDSNGNAYTVTHDMLVMLALSLDHPANYDYVVRNGFKAPNKDRYYKGRTGEAYDKGSARILPPNAKENNLLYKERNELRGELRETEDEERRQEIRDRIEEIDAQLDENLEAAREWADDLQSKVKAAMNDYDRKWFDAWRTFAEKSQGYLNEATQKMYGFDRATVENYFPIRTDSRFGAASFESLVHDFTLEGLGFMKERTGTGLKPLYLEGVSYIAHDHIRKVAQYAAMAPALRDLSKITGKTAIMEDGEAASLLDTLGTVYDKKARVWLENLIADLNGARKRDNWRLFGKLRSSYAGAVLTLNPSVSFAQIASAPTTAAVLGGKAVAKAYERHGLPFAGKADTELIAKWTSILYNRNMGYSERGASEQAGRQSRLEALERKAKFIFGWINAADNYTVNRIWWAAEYYVQDHMPELYDAKAETQSDEYYEAVAEMFERAIQETQPSYDVLQRPDILRNPNELVRSLTMFMTQRLQNYSIAYESSRRYQRYRYDFKHGENGVTAEDVRAAKMQLVNSATSLLVSSAMIVAFKTLAALMLYRLDPWRDEDEELTAASISSHILDMFADTMISNFLGGSEAYSLAKRIIGGKDQTYYGIEVNGVERLNDTIDGITKLSDTIVQPLREGKDIEWDKAGMQFKKSGKTIVETVTGLPVTNAGRLADAAWNWASDFKDGKIDFEERVERNKTINARRLVKAYLAGDEEKVKKVEAEFDDKKDADTQVKKYVKAQYKDGEMTREDVTTILSGQVKMSGDDIHWWFDEVDAEIAGEDYAKYDDFVDAVETGKDLKKVIKTYTDNGVDTKTLASQITKNFKPQYVAASKSERAKLKGYLLNAYVALGYDREKKSKDIDKWLDDAE